MSLPVKELVVLAEEDGPINSIKDDNQQPLLGENAPEGGEYGAVCKQIAILDKKDKEDKERTKYEKAALLVRQGEDNDKFYQDIEGKWSNRAYQALHNTVYYVFNLCVCTLLLFLALMEHPYLGDEANLPQGTLVAIVVVHALLEIFLLSLLWLDMVLKLVWLREKFFTHGRTIFILVVLVVMSVEVIVVLAQQQNHFRIMRALRPIFLLDTFFMQGVRRILRHIFVPSILHILNVILFLILSLVIFSLLGYLIFAELDITYFVSFKKTLVSFFIASTTANSPDMWLEAYIRQPASALFFILYIIVMVYFISNVLLAVVYSRFSKADKKKFKKMFLHKRDALRRAYKALALSPPDGIKFHDFLFFMHEYRPRIPEWQVMCIFKTLHRDPSDDDDEGVKDLSLEQFYGFYEVFNFKWRQVSSEGEELTWFQHSCPAIKIRTKFVHKIVKSNLFNFVINVVVVANLIFLVAYTYFFIDDTDVSNRFFILNKVVAVSLVFVCIYVVEICLRIVGVGPYNYFRKPQNILDTLVILTSFVLLILEAVSPAHSVLAVFRPVKFIRLLCLKRRYREILNTLYVLSLRLITVGLLILVVYYAFAIIGMEFLSDTVFEGCCNESMYGVGQYYSGMNGMNGINSNFTINVYYVLNFDNILRSYVTLFVLMVINNWFIIMEGFASTSPNSWLVRIYFMSFYLFTLMVLQVIISFIVEAFVFQIQPKERRCHCHQHPCQCQCQCHQHPCQCHNENEGKKDTRKEVVNIKLSKADIDKLRYEMAYSDETEGVINKWIRHRRRVNLDNLTDTWSLSRELRSFLAFRGCRLRTKDDIHLLMYRSELVHWIQDQEMNREEVKASWTKYLKKGVLYIVE